MTERSPFWCIGHRGSPTFEPENTRESFERALDRDGANGLELDLCVTKDRGIVVWHDWSPHGFEALCRESGLEPDVAFRPLPPQRGMLRRKISELYLDDVVKHFGYASKDGPRERIASARVMTWDEVCVLVASRPAVEVIFLDIKVPSDEVELVPDLVACVERRLAERKVACTIVYECTHRDVLAALKRAAPAHRGFSIDVGPLFGLRPGVRTYSAARRAIDHKNAYATPERPRACCWRPWQTYRRIAEHDLRLRTEHNAACAPAEQLRRIVGFTVNADAELAELVSLGIQGLQTDRPHALASLLRRGKEELLAVEPAAAREGRHPDCTSSRA